MRSHQLCYLVHLNYMTKNPSYFAVLYHLLIAITLLRRKGSHKRNFTMLKLHILHLQSRPSTYFNNAFPGDSCGEGNGTPLQYSCLENPMDGGAW